MKKLEHILQAATAERYEFLCRGCGRRLAGPLPRLLDAGAIRVKDQRPIFDPGRFAVSDLLAARPELGAVPPGEVIVVAEDLSGVTHGVGSDVGCCGPRGAAPNLACLCGRVIGTERADCMQPHFVSLDVSAVRLRPCAEGGGEGGV